MRGEKGLCDNSEEYQYLKCGCRGKIFTKQTEKDHQRAGWGRGDEGVVKDDKC